MSPQDSSDSPQPAKVRAKPPSNVYTVLLVCATLCVIAALTLSGIELYLYYLREAPPASAAPARAKAGKPPAKAEGEEAAGKSKAKPGAETQPEGKAEGKAEAPAPKPAEGGTGKAKGKAEAPAAPSPGQ